MQSYFNLKEKLISAEEGRISEDIKKKRLTKKGTLIKFSTLDFFLILVICFTINKVKREKEGIYRDLYAAFIKNFWKSIRKKGLLFPLK